MDGGGGGRLGDVGVVVHGHEHHGQVLEDPHHLAGVAVVRLHLVLEHVPVVFRVSVTRWQNFIPLLSLDCALMSSTLAQSKERKGSNFAIC